MIKKIQSLTGGLLDLPNPENLKDEQLQESVNYEILGDGSLHKRKDPDEYGDDVELTSLKDVLSPYFNTINQVSPPYYPVRKLSDMTGKELKELIKDTVLELIDPDKDGHFSEGGCSENQRPCQSVPASI